MSGDRKTALYAILGLLFVFAGGLYLSVRVLADGAPRLLGGDRVAVLPLEGVIVSERGFLERLEGYRDDGSVRAFVLEIRSPGGAVGASQSLYRTIRDLRETDERPVIAWIGDVGASGGYYVALAADSIYALPGSITGSIGVIMEFPDAQELLRKVGLRFEVVKSGEHKDMGSFVRPMSDGDREILEGVVRDVWEQFVEAVGENRGMTRERVVGLADGRIFTGEQARDLGLVDGIGTLQEAIDAAGRMAGLGEGPPTVRPRERRLGLLDLLLGSGRARWEGLLEPLSRAAERGTPRLLYEWR